MTCNSSEVKHGHRGSVKSWSLQLNLVRGLISAVSHPPSFTVGFGNEWFLNFPHLFSQVNCQKQNATFWTPETIFEVRHFSGFDFLKQLLTSGSIKLTLKPLNRHSFTLPSRLCLFYFEALGHQKQSALKKTRRKVFYWDYFANYDP